MGPTERLDGGGDPRDSDVNPHIPRPMPESSRGWTTKMTARLPDGVVLALVAVADMPPGRTGLGLHGWTPWIAPVKWPYEEGGDFEHMCSLSVSGQDTLERGVMSGELPLTYLPLYFLLSPSPFIFLIPSLLLPCHILTSSTSIDCDCYGHSHVM
jgi:hypothetical protein